MCTYTIYSNSQYTYLVLRFTVLCLLIYFETDGLFYILLCSTTVLLTRLVLHVLYNYIITRSSCIRILIIWEIGSTK